MASRKGVKNRRTWKVEEIADRYMEDGSKLDPFEVLLMVAAGDWESLGFEAKSKISYTNAGIEFEEPNIKLNDRVQAAKEAAKYLYSQRQSVAISTGDSGIRIIIDDFISKKKDQNE